MLPAWLPTCLNLYHLLLTAFVTTCWDTSPPLAGLPCLQMLPWAIICRLLVNPPDILNLPPGLSPIKAFLDSCGCCFRDCSVSHLGYVSSTKTSQDSSAGDLFSLLYASVVYSPIHFSRTSHFPPQMCH